MKAQLAPKHMRTGYRTYTVSSDSYGDKRSIDVTLWEVRSIKQKRGSKSRHGREFLRNVYDTRKFVNLTARVPHATTNAKTGKWLTSISNSFRISFPVGQERLPTGHYSSLLNAIKYAIVKKEEKLVRHQEGLARVTDPEDIEDWTAIVADTKAEIKLLKSRLTKETNIRNKAKDSKANTGY